VLSTIKLCGPGPTCTAKGLKAVPEVAATWKRKKTRKKRRNFKKSSSVHMHDFCYSHQLDNRVLYNRKVKVQRKYFKKNPKTPPILKKVLTTKKSQLCGAKNKEIEIYPLFANNKGELKTTALGLSRNQSIFKYLLVIFNILIGT
jgi:hypothetical protein